MKSILLFVLCFSYAFCLLPPKFQWKYMDYNWTNSGIPREGAVRSGDYNPANNLPTGIARWRDKLFITIPRWKRGIPSNLNYVNLDSSDQSPPLNPYPSWKEGFMKSKACCTHSSATVVCAFRMHIDCCDRLWLADNGVVDMASCVKQIVDPAVVVFDLKTNKLLRRFILPDEVLEGKTIMTSITVDMPMKKKCLCNESYAYITDMGANAIIVYSFHENQAWRVEHPFFKFDPKAGLYNVSGLDFFWNDGISTAALAKPDKNGFRDLYFTPTSSTKQFKMSSKCLRNKNVTYEELFRNITVLGDRGPRSQVTACAYDQTTNVLFFTQVCKNGFGCWNLAKPYTPENAQCIVSDCILFEFPSDIKVDDESNVWVLSDRQSRYLYQDMNFTELNFRVMTAPSTRLIAGTNCDKARCFLFKRKSDPVF